MQKDYKISSYNGIVPEEYQQPFFELYEAIYQKDTSAVENKLLDILKTVLKHHPEKPKEGDVVAKGDRKVLELLGVDLDIDYEQWLEKVKGISDHIVYFENNEVLMENVHNPSKMSDLIFDIMHYVEWEMKQYHDRDKLMLELETYEKYTH